MLVDCTVKCFEVHTETIDHLADSRDWVVTKDFAETLRLIELVADKPSTVHAFGLVIADMDVCEAR